VDGTARFIVGGTFNLNTVWLSQFREAYRSTYGTYPRVAGWHSHWYQDVNYDTTTWRQNIQAFRQWIDANGGGEFWLSEFGDLNSLSRGQRIMQEQVPWLETYGGVQRYAWFATKSNGPGCETCQGSLLNDDGTRTPLGDLYRSLP